MRRTDADETGAGQVRERLDKLGRRWPLLGWVLALQDRVGELRGGSAAASITLTVFLAIFPLLLVAIAVIGFVSSSGADVTGSLIRNLGLTGNSADTIRTAVDRARHSATAASVVGLLGLLWSGLGVVAALERAVNLPWQTKGRGIKSKLLGIGWMLGVVVLLAATFAVSAVLNFLPAFLAPVSVVIGLALDLALFLWTFWLFCTASVPWRTFLPGAILATVGFGILKWVGAIYVPHAVASSSALYGSIGVVFAILAWLLVFGRLLVYASVLNVVVYERRVGTVTLEIQAPDVPRDPVLHHATRSGVVVPDDDADDDADADADSDADDAVDDADEATRAAAS